MKNEVRVTLGTLAAIIGGLVAVFAAAAAFTYRLKLSKECSGFDPESGCLGTRPLLDAALWLLGGVALFILGRFLSRADTLEQPPPT